MRLHLHCGKHGIGFQLPTTPADVQKTFDTLREGLGQDVPVKIGDVDSPVSFLYQYIKNIDLTSGPELEKLNRLSEKVDGMNTQEQHIFWGALDNESINGLDDVLRVASSLAQYEFVEGVTSYKHLGGWLVEQGLTGTDFPIEVRPYLNYEGIGLEYGDSHGGAFTPYGYVKRRETAPELPAENKTKLSLTLRSGDHACRIDFPASKGELAAAGQSLGVDGLTDDMIESVQIGYSWSDHLPLNDVTLESFNMLAQYVAAMSKSELVTFGAALEAVGPGSFSDAVCIAEDLNDYELVDVTESAYGRAALRRAGANDAVFDLLDDFLDYERLGRAQMEADDVCATSFGLIRCPSEHHIQYGMGGIS